MPLGWWYRPTRSPLGCLIRPRKCPAKALGRLVRGKTAPRPFGVGLFSVASPLGRDRSRPSHELDDGQA